MPLVAASRGRWVRCAWLALFVLISIHCRAEDTPNSSRSTSSKGVKQTGQNDFKQTGQNGFKQTRQNGFKQTGQNAFKKTRQNGFKQTRQNGFKQTGQNGFKETGQNGFKKTRQNGFKQTGPNVFKQTGQNGFEQKPAESKTETKSLILEDPHKEETEQRCTRHEQLVDVGCASCASHNPVLWSMHAVNHLAKSVFQRTEQCERDRGMFVRYDFGQVLTKIVPKELRNSVHLKLCFAKTVEYSKTPTTLEILFSSNKTLGTLLISFVVLAGSSTIQSDVHWIHGGLAALIAALGSAGVRLLIRRLHMLYATRLFEDLLNFLDCAVDDGEPVQVFERLHQTLSKEAVHDLMKTYKKKF